MPLINIPGPLHYQYHHQYHHQYHWYHNLQTIPQSRHGLITSHVILTLLSHLNIYFFVCLLGQIIVDEFAMKTEKELDLKILFLLSKNELQSIHDT